MSGRYEGVIVLAGVSMCIAAEDPWRLKLSAPGFAVTVRPDGSDAKAATDKTVDGVLSPDGKARARVEVRDIVVGGQAPPALFVTDADARRFRFVDFDGDQPAWSPDGKSVVYRSSSGITQIRTAEVPDAGVECIRVAVRKHNRISNAKLGAHSPRYLADGRIVWLEWNSTHGKLRNSDLVIFDGKAARKLVEDLYVSDFAASPDGKTVAYGTVGSLVFLDVETGRKTAVAFDKLHEKLHAHAATGIAWRPDGKAVACKIGFLGGRMAGTVVFGDAEVFVIPVEGKAAWFTMDERLATVSELGGTTFRWYAPSIGWTSAAK